MAAGSLAESVAVCEHSIGHIPGGTTAAPDGRTVLVLVKLADCLLQRLLRFASPRARRSSCCPTALTGP